MYLGYLVTNPQHIKENRCQRIELTMKHVFQVVGRAIKCERMLYRINDMEVWMTLYPCDTYRSVQLELVPSMFICALFLHSDDICSHTEDRV